MFKINIYLRFALIAIGLIGGILLSVFMGFWYGFPFWLIGIILAVGYLVMGTVQSAAELLQTQQFDAAEKRLKLTFKPEWLVGPTRAYYFIVRATVAMNRGQHDIAEKWLLKAEKLDLPSQDEQAMIQVQLANIHASRQKWQSAQIYLRNAKQLKVSTPEIKDQILQLEKALKNRGQLKHLHQGGRKNQMQQKGGKRRRPKTR